MLSVKETYLVKKLKDKGQNHASAVKQWVLS